MEPASSDPLDDVRRALDGLDDQPVASHVTVLAGALDTLVGQLDELARSIPSAR